MKRKKKIGKRRPSLLKGPIWMAEGRGRPNPCPREGLAVAHHGEGLPPPQGKSLPLLL